ncbi:MAG: hypothetical protein GY832_02110, partial [Chloroflexi bacterium]|nr:hypothetical protein [Chloroflexota bacterium]
AVVCAENGFGVESIPIKKLWGKNRSAAISARDRADLMRAKLEEQLSGPPQERAERLELSQGQVDAEVAEVVQAYQEVIDHYPHTEIAAYCAVRLSGFFVFMGKADEAAGLMQQTVREFAGTSEETRIIFELGLIHAQSRHDPAEAIEWLSRIPKPEETANGQYGEDHKLYLSAQEQLVKCELALEQDAGAKQRVDHLRKVFPQYAEDVERFHQFEVDSRNTPRKVSPNRQTGNRNRGRTVMFVVAAHLLAVSGFLVVIRQIKKRRRT